LFRAYCLRFDLSTLAPISTCCYNPYEPELKAYDGTLYAFGNNSVRKITFNGSSVVTTAMTGDRVELRNNHTYDVFTFFPDGNGIRVNFLENQYYNPDYDMSEYMTVLGDEKTSPYSVSIMMMARDNLVTEGVLQPGEVTDEDLAPTHYYVRFEPQNDEEMNLLDENENVFVFDYPLDHEIIYSGVYYRDPNVPENQPTYQYAVVRVDEDLPDIQYFILDYYLLEPIEEEDMTPFFMNYFPLLEVEAFKIVDLPYEKILHGWEPGGNIRVYDTTIGQYVPVKNASVTIFFPARNDYAVVSTDNNGWFRLGRDIFYPHVEYSVRWGWGRTYWAGHFPLIQLQMYTVLVIKDSIRNLSKFSKWKDELISRYPQNPTNIYLDELFDQYKKKGNVNWKNPGDPGC